MQFSNLPFYNKTVQLKKSFTNIPKLGLSTIFFYPLILFVFITESVDKLFSFISLSDNDKDKKRNCYFID